VKSSMKVIGSLLTMVMIVALTGGLSVAFASQKKSNTSGGQSAPAKAAPAPAKAATAAPATKSGTAPQGRGGIAPQARGAGAVGTVAKPGGTPPPRVPPPPSKPPAGEAAKPAGGGNYRPHTGEVQKTDAAGRVSYRDPTNGRTVMTNRHGQITRIEGPRSFDGRQMVISRNPHGAREVIMGRPGNRIVTYGRGRGFVERPLRQGYISRTYVVHGRAYARVYHESVYGRFHYYRYVPSYYYAPAFYGWAVTPWGAPLVYGWAGPMGAPWFTFYGGYFAPYPTYVSANLWLTDYLLAKNLEMAYESQQQGNPDAAPEIPAAQTPLSPDTKAMIAEEVRQQLAAEQAAALVPATAAPQQPTAGAEPLPPSLTQKFFVVSASLDVTANGQACSLTPGDIIQRRTSTVAADGTVAVEVVSSKPWDCGADSQTAVDFAALEEMHNQFQERLDEGLKTLADGGVRGVAAPPSGMRAAADGTATPAGDAATQLSAQETSASNLEAQVRQNQ